MYIEKQGGVQMLLPLRNFFSEIIKKRTYLPQKTYNIEKVYFGGEKLPDITLCQCQKNVLNHKNQLTPLFTGNLLKEYR